MEDRIQLIAALSTELQQCAQKQLDLLNRRATMLASCARFDKALRDAAAMRAIDDSSVTGYICAGDIYAQQGRQSAAIDMYNQGLGSIPASDAAGRQRLEKARAKASERNNKRIDMIGEFPLDVAKLIISILLPTDDVQRAPCALLHVSQNWRERVLLCNDGFRFEVAHASDLGRGLYHVVNVAQYVRSLRIRECNEPFYRLLTRGTFSSLRELYIQQSNCPFDAETTCNALRPVGKTLRHLELVYWPDDMGVAIRLGQILESCPNLEYLACLMIYMDMTSAASQYPKLKTLALRQCAHFVTSKMLIDTVKRLPALQQLVVNRCLCTHALPEIQDYCPDLRHIGFRDIFYDTFGSDGYFEHADDDKHQTAAGLDFELLIGNDMDVDARDVVAFLERNACTLSRMTLDCPFVAPVLPFEPPLGDETDPDIGVGEQPEWVHGHEDASITAADDHAARMTAVEHMVEMQTMLPDAAESSLDFSQLVNTLPDVQFSCLVYFKYNFSDEINTALVLWIVRHAPNLREVHLSDLGDSEVWTDFNPLLNALADLPFIEKVTLDVPVLNAADGMNRLRVRGVLAK